MNEKTQTPLPIYIDGELAMDYMSPSAPRPSALDVLKQGVGEMVDSVKLEARMVVFDAFHGTHYRKVRHELMAIKKREQFEQSIGLVAISN
jgi:hypothetical protein